ncbi:GH25 family lysozyme [Streptomyces sp. NBC_01007]|nr:GH25 family lysozyme [Streptomyces sp. NBC_01007]
MNRRSAKAKGARFVHHVKATGSTARRKPYLARQYDGARDAGVLHDAYHFARRRTARPGTAQAAHFVHNGGHGARTAGHRSPRRTSSTPRAAGTSATASARPER